MSYITSLTNAQLQELRDNALKLEKLIQQFAQGTITETTVTFTVASGAITAIALS